MVYLLRTDGVYHYTGTPFQWQQIDNGTDTVAIIQDYQLRKDGAVLKSGGAPFQ